MRIIQRPAWLFWLLLLLALLSYSLPWVITPGVSLSLGAVDLAEWASLHPAVRAASPPLLISFLLRMPLMILALIVAFANYRSRWPRVFVVLLIAAALLPPLEFFTQYRDDPNYRQQFTLAVLTFAGGVAGIMGRPPRWRSILSIILPLVATAAAVIGFVQAYRLLADFHLPVQPGFGVIGFAACGLAFALFQSPLRAAITKRVARA